MLLSYLFLFMPTHMLGLILGQTRLRCLASHMYNDLPVQLTTMWYYQDPLVFCLGAEAICAERIL